MELNWTTQPAPRHPVPLSLSKAAATLGVSPEVAQKGYKGGTLPSLDLMAIAEVAGRPVLDRLEIGGHPIPVLRPGLKVLEAGGTRPWYGWAIDQPIAETTRALDRWWPTAGWRTVANCGGFVVAVGSVVCAVFGDVTEEGITTGTGEYEGRISYNATLAGLLRSGGEVEITGNASETWARLATEILGLRVLGGGGGSFTTLTDSGNDSKGKCDD